MWLNAQNEMTGIWPHAAMGPVERTVRRRGWRRYVHDLGSGEVRYTEDFNRF